MSKFLTALPLFVSAFVFLLLLGWGGETFAKNYYQVLGVPAKASTAEIKTAYRRMAMKYHPDRDKTTKAGSEDKFKEVKEAFDVLSDPEKRAEYDQTLAGNFTRTDDPSNSNWDALWRNVTRASTFKDLIRAKDAALAAAPTNDDFTQVFLYRVAGSQNDPAGLFYFDDLHMMFGRFQEMGNLLTRHMLKFWTLKPRPDQIAAVGLASGSNALLYGMYRTFLQAAHDPTRYIEILNYDFQRRMNLEQQDYIFNAARETVLHFREINDSPARAAELFDVLQRSLGVDSARKIMRVAYPTDKTYRLTCGEILGKIFRW